MFKKERVVKQVFRVFLVLGSCIYMLNAAYLTPDLQEKVDRSLPDEKVKIIVRMKLEADLSTLERSGREAMVQRLKSFANEYQKELLADMTLFGDQVSRIVPFWIYNGIAMEATRSVIATLLMRQDVGYIESDGIVTVDAVPADDIRKAYWNINLIKAPEVWRLGITGKGIVIGNLDSGVDVTHPSFSSRWRQQNGWYDAVSNKSTPYDDFGHGTHVNGILCGGSASTTIADTIGVAPGATFIAAKALNSSGAGNLSDLDECLQWFANLGQNAPDIINNSWGCSGSDTHFWQSCRNLQSMKIVVVFANGNAGPNTGTVNAAGSYPLVFGIGATDNKDGLYAQSSRGPSPKFYSITENASEYLDPNWATSRRKPDLSAPGVNIMSSKSGGGTVSMTGTSMAAPHVAGAIALLLENSPSLTPKQVWSILTSNVDKPAGGEPYPNNNYGWGRLNIYNAIAATPIAKTGKGQVQEQIVLTVHPNRASGYTQVAFLLDKESHIRLDVYNAQGQRIARLADKKYGHGRHEVRWNIQNLCSGMYICRCNADNVTVIRKILLAGTGR